MRIWGTKLKDFRIGEYAEYFSDYHDSEAVIHRVPVSEEVARGMIIGLRESFRRVGVTVQVRDGDEVTEEISISRLPQLTDEQERALRPDRIVCQIRLLDPKMPGGWINKGFICVGSESSFYTRKVFVYQHDFSWYVITAEWNK